MIDVNLTRPEATHNGTRSTRQDTFDPTRRPAAVVGAFWMTLVGTVTAILSNVFELKDELARHNNGALSDLVITIVFIALFGFYAEMLRRGRQWGRVTLALFAALGLVFNTLGLLRVGGRPIDGTVDRGLTIISTIATVLGLVWMFTPSTNAWFKAVGHKSREVSPSMRKLMLTLHVAFSVGWLGLIVGMDAMAIVGAATNSTVTENSIYTVMTLMDEIFLGMTSLFALLTGLIGAVGTKWHLMRRYWISTKFLMTLGLMAFGFGVNHPLIAKATALVAAGAPPAQVRTAGIPLAICASFAVAMLIFMTVLSTYKPWGLTRYGRRKQAASTRVRPSVVPIPPTAVNRQREAA